MREAPPASAFAKVWGARCRGTVGSGGITGVAGVHSIKRQQLEFCVAEAMRMRDRARLSECQTLVTHVDGKGKLLSMRVPAKPNELISKTVGLGHVKHASGAGSVEAYVASVLQLLRRCCALFGDAPEKCGLFLKPLM